jgi:AraC family transcriptional regulator of adaptative response / DNA-3-methyladenine glycosylase II
MELSRQDYYRALKAQDARFDGRFYICVTSTGIYCRPICPARTTKLANCIFVKSAAEAEENGYRPCLRCRPETAPGAPARLGTQATTRRALRLMSKAAAQGESLEDFSDRLGVSSRHLRRLFKEHLGASPKSIIQTERFAIARQLLVETRVPIAQVALASGFGSIRRFNDAVRKAFGVTPGDFRKKRTYKPTQLPGHKVLLGYRPPYDFDAMLGYLAARAIPGVEKVEDGTWSRCMTLAGVPGIVSVSHEEAKHRLVARFDMKEPVVIVDGITRVKDLFDLDAAPSEICEHLRTAPALKASVKARPGLRVPGCWDVFELIARAIIGQQISVAGATTMLGRLTEAFGRHPDLGGAEPGAGDSAGLFPRPEDLVGKDLTKIGLTRSRAATLASVAQKFASDPDFVDAAMDVEDARARLLAIKGIGPWTAEYVILRALRNPDAFPASDLVLLKSAGLKKPKDLKAIAEAWRPWRGYAAQHLWASYQPEKKKKAR